MGRIIIEYSKMYYICVYISTMSIENGSKIINLVSATPSGSIVLSSWLAEQGYSFSLQKKYRNSGWLQSIGNGAMILVGQSPNFLGAIYALQQQMNLTTHPAAETALSLQGLTHNIVFSEKKLILFSDEKERLPKWFREYAWENEIDHHATHFLPPDIGLVDYSFQGMNVKISSPVRAVMECIYLAKTNDDIVACYQLLEGLNAAHPKTVKALLMKCKSVKVVRLFLFMAKKAGHSWYEYLNLDYAQLKFGQGSRSVSVGKGGIYIPEFQLIVPRQLVSL